MFISCGRCKTVGMFYVYNNTDRTLFMETNIIHHPSSWWTNTDLDIEQGDKKPIAQTKNYTGEKFHFDISDFVENEDAYVKVYLDSFATVPIKEWKYIDRNSSGRQLFNLDFSVFSECGMVDGSNNLIYTFSIENEDIKESK